MNSSLARYPGLERHGRKPIGRGRATYDAIVIGGGHNGLVAAAYLGARRDARCSCSSAATASAAPR